MRSRGYEGTFHNTRARAATLLRSRQWRGKVKKKKRSIGIADFVIFARATIRLSARQRGVPAVFRAKTAFGYFPDGIEVRAPRAFLKEVAFSGARTIRVEIYGTAFRCTILGHNKKTFRPMVLTAQFLSGVARGLTERSLPSFLRRRDGRAK
jgi:hypothetical protein